MNIDRYAVDPHQGGLSEHDKGDFVRYDDYLELKAQREELLAALKNTNTSAQSAIYAIEETGGKFSYSASVLREQVKNNTDLIAKCEAQS